MPLDQLAVPALRASASSASLLLHLNLAMSVHELTTEQLQVRSWPGTHLTPEDCLSAVRNLKGSTVVVTGELGARLIAAANSPLCVTGAGSGFGRGYSLLAAKHGRVALPPAQREVLRADG